MIDDRELHAMSDVGRPPWPSPHGQARLELTLVPNVDRCTVTMVGTLDAWSASAVDTQYDQLLGASFTEVILDISELVEIDESGAVALTRLWALLSNSGVLCRLRGLAPEFSDNPLELLLFVRAATTHSDSAGPDRAIGLVPVDDDGRF